LELKKAFFSAIDNDLDTPVALAVVWEMLKDPELSNSEKLELMRDFDSIIGLGIDEFKAPVLSDEHMGLIKNREAVREQKNWAQADAMRDQLLADGICIKDTKTGTQWYLVNK